MTKIQTVARRQPAAPIRLVRETVAELRKVNWPSRPEVLRMTGLVLVVMFFTGVALGALDYIFSRLIALAVGAGL